MTAWPRLDSGKIQIDGDAFKIMYHVPGIEELHALKDSLGVIVRAKLPIGPDGRNRPSLFPFCTATGRNAHARACSTPMPACAASSPFRPTRSAFISTGGRRRSALPPHYPKTGIDGRLSGGDVYYALAVMCGLTDDPDVKHWKKTNKSMRQRMKSLQLGINYGMGVPSLARGLRSAPADRQLHHRKHKRTYARYWEWKEERANTAMQDRELETQFGWPLYLSHSPNRRTIYNFPMQGNGAEMLWLAATRMCEAGIIPSMLVHDAVLLEADSEEQIAHAVEIMERAGADVCNGFKIGVDVERMEIGGRFHDKRPAAEKIWATIMLALQEVGALPKGQLP